MTPPPPSEQLGFLGAATISPATGRALTPKQQKAYDWIRSSAGGVTATELGLYFHAVSFRHSGGYPCEWCERAGLAVLQSVALKPLVIRRRKTGRWEARDGSTPPAEVQPSSQIRDGQLPDWLGGEE